MSGRSDSVVNQMPQKRLPRPHLRLDNAQYSRTDLVCSITICLRNREPLFAEGAFASRCVAVLRSCALETGVLVYGYCLMPDHCHLVISASPSCDVIAFVSRLKSLTQRAAWTLGYPGAIWRRRSWDRFLRADDRVVQTVNYVLHNPVRRGLVASAAAYAYSGRSSGSCSPTIPRNRRRPGASLAGHRSLRYAHAPSVSIRGT
jgi:putative transposase